MVVEPGALEVEESRRLAYSDNPARLDFDVLSGGIGNACDLVAVRVERQFNREDLGRRLSWCGGLVCKIHCTEYGN